MGAASKPRSGVPEKHGKADVNPLESSPKEDLSITDEPQPEVTAEAPDFGDEDLKGFEEDKKIPYQRFKEVNLKKRTLEKQIEELQRQREGDIRRATEDAELRMQAKYQSMQQPQQDPYLAALSDDPLVESRTVQTLKEQVESLRQEMSGVKSNSEAERLEKQLDRLEAKYPSMDRLSVLGWYRANPRTDLEDLAVTSHERELSKEEAVLRRAIDRKKERQKSAIPTGTGAVRLTPDQRPKSMKDAHKMVKQLSDSLFKQR